MSESNPNPTGNEPAGDQPTVEQLQAQLASAQAERDEAKAMLMDPQYLRFLAGPDPANQPGKAPAAQPESRPPAPTDPLADLTDDQLREMSPRELINLAVRAQSAKLEAVTTQISEQLKGLTEAVIVREAKADVEAARAQFKDFDDFKPAMMKLVQRPEYANLDAKSLYYIAKGQSGGGPTGPTRAQAAAAARAGSEKPGAHGAGTSPSNEPDKFDPKDEVAAAKAALATVSRKYNGAI